MDALIFGALGAFLAVLGVLYQTRCPLRVSRTTQTSKSQGVFSLTVKNVGPGEELLILEVRIPVENNDLDTTFKSLDQNVELRAAYRSVVGIPYSLLSKGK